MPGEENRAVYSPAALTAIRPPWPSRRSSAASASVHASSSERAAEPHQGVDLVGHRDADDRLAVAGAGDGDAGVVGPGARADQRRVADAAAALAHRAAGRGRRREPAVEIARDSAHRPGRPAGPAGGEHRPLAVGDEVAGLAQLDALIGGERARRRAHEQDVVAVAQHRAGGAHRVAHALHAGHRATWRPVPSITDASSSTPPSWVSAAPRPALNSGSSSSTTTAASTASSALPPAASTA